MSLAECFVIMSFEPALQPTYDEGIKPVVEKFGVSCLRADEIASPGEIYDEIVRLIGRSYFVVADLTDARPNCYYELGFAHALGRKRNVIITARTGSGIHFDLQGFRTLYYESPAELATKLERVIHRAFFSTLETHHEEDPNRGAFGGYAFDGRRVLTARIVDESNWKARNTVYTIRLQLDGLPGSPLTGDVEFNTYRGWGTIAVRAKHGVASTVIDDVAGAFTVGVVADGGKTRLEFDLGKLPGAVEGFYDPSKQV